MKKNVAHFDTYLMININNPKEQLIQSNDDKELEELCTLFINLNLN